MKVTDYPAGDAYQKKYVSEKQAEEYWTKGKQDGEPSAEGKKNIAQKNGSDNTQKSEYWKNYTRKTFSGSSDRTGKKTAQKYGKYNGYGAQKSKSQTRKKKLNYNSRDVRFALARAVKSQSAGMVLSSAKSRLVSLLKCKGTGMYEENELNAAITHARRMVRCAQLKVRNLKKEEAQQRRNEKAARDEDKDQGIEQFQKALRQKQRKLELAKKRRMHRILERAKMEQADDEYKAKQIQNQKEKDGSSLREFYGANVRDLSDLELQKLELEIMRDEAKLSMELGENLDGTVDAGVAAAVEGMSSGSTGGTGTGDMAAPEGGGDLAGGSIDIFL